MTRPTGSRRRFAGLVAITILLIPGATGAQEAGDRRSATAREFAAAYAARDWPRALERGLALEALEPGLAVHGYNLACVHALSGDTDGAFRWLTSALDRGFSDVRTLERDEDLDAVRGDPRYAAALQRARDLSAEDWAAFEALARDSRPVIIVPGGMPDTGAVPAIVVLHGFGGESRRFAELYRRVAVELGAIVVAPTSVLPARPGARDAFSWGSLEQAEHLVLRALESARRYRAIRTDHVFLSGFSQGGEMAYAIGLRHPELFRGVVPIAGHYDPAMLATRPAAARAKQRFAALVGSEDASLAANRRAEIDLTAAGIPIDLRIFEGLGHSLPDQATRELIKALRWTAKD